MYVQDGSSTQPTWDSRALASLVRISPQSPPLGRVVRPSGFWGVDIKELWKSEEACPQNPKNPEVRRIPKSLPQEEKQGRP